MMKLFRAYRGLSVSVLSAIILGGCASADRPSLLTTPSSARPRPIQETSANMGSLYPANSGGPYVNAVSHRPLFEDRRARNVGDTLTVVLNETTSAAKNSGMSAARKANASSEFGNTSTTPFGPYTSIANIANFGGAGDIKSEGTGASAASNTFAGTITVTVVEILSNGNLVVAGEKQVAVSNEEEIIRFGGVVNPNTLVFNQVSSQQVADARIEYRGRGATDDTQGTGWFTRLMLKLAPF
ncbi:flagellar basal body L-ring protein FlgH [Polynucleobacter sp. AP-Jannik-300A-C4]|jgi:flagellar L-ring protein precursor FlgH|uniref:flagellar basal body L-ring protein FlgH n=2 Tax=unclassified Polynucleobacter TaxID=2640945 RepID=UPI001BFD5066|nr:flagellar basal body L-ring protein FlgH [Polynucleobacter sp. AP-Jannik-300A-C4]QWE23082.1 flagellar basal body L-ring protein FlgH [Polynucleobacter sp. AP-Jannik-300A-C4]